STCSLYYTRISKPKDLQEKNQKRRKKMASGGIDFQLWFGATFLKFICPNSNKWTIYFFWLGVCKNRICTPYGYIYFVVYDSKLYHYISHSEKSRRISRKSLS